MIRYDLYLVIIDYVKACQNTVTLGNTLLPGGPVTACANHYLHRVTYKLTKH